MIELWLRCSLKRQILSIIGIGLVISALDFWLTPTPLLRSKSALILQGLVAGGLITLFSSFLHLLGFFSPWTKHLSELKQLKNRYAAVDIWTFVGATLFVAAEEILFRGYVLNPLLRLGMPLAFLLHGLIVFPFVYAGKRALLYALIRLVEFSFLGYLFTLTRSLSTCMAAGIVLYTLSELFFRQTLSRFSSESGFRRQIRALFSSSVV